MQLENPNSRHDYLIKGLVVSGLSSSVAFCVLVLGMAFYVAVAIPGSQLLTPDSIVTRSAFGIAAFILAVTIVYLSKRIVSKYIPYWFAIPLFGSLILIVSVNSILIIGRIIENRIPSDQEVLFPQSDVFPVLPTLTELVIFTLAPFTATIAVATLASFLVHTLRLRFK